MNRRSFLKLSALGVAGAGLALRSGAIFAVPRIVKPAASDIQGMEAWLPGQNVPQPFFGLDRSGAYDMLKELYSPGYRFEVGEMYTILPPSGVGNDPSVMVVTAVDRAAGKITVSPFPRLKK